MSSLIEKIELQRKLLKDKPKETQIFIPLNIGELRHINVALKLWDYADTILDEELNLK